MSAANFQKYSLKLILMGNRDTPKYQDKTHSGIYAAIPFQILIGHNTYDNVNPLHC